MDVHPLVTQAKDHRQSVRAALCHKGVLIPAANWDASETCSAILFDWRAKVSAQVAALTVPFLEFELVSEKSLKDRYGAEIVRLALSFHRWRKTVCSAELRDRELSETATALELRFLYREVYKGLPDLSFVLLVLASRKAALSLDSELSPRLRSYIDGVLVPLAQMLGLWSLRRDFLEATQAGTELYRAIAPFLSEPEIETAGGSLAMPLDRRSSQNKRLNRAKLIRLEKSKSYCEIRNQLETMFRQRGIVPKPRVLMIIPSAGIATSRARAGESQHDLATRLSIRILCHTVEECYRVLGFVHGLGRPITPRITERFNDYNSSRFNDFIASPLPNGYRALHTAIVYQADKSTGKQIVVEFRILTPLMHRLNEFGVIAALRKFPSKYSNSTARWNMKSTSDEDNFGTKYRLDNKTQALVGKYELDSRPAGDDPLFVFSPHGELRLLPDESTALDFAYHIHSELAHQTVKIEVNGQTMPFNVPLKNGDLIRVYYDSHFAGPDMLWLGCVTTERARQGFRSGLTKRAKKSKGRVLIQDALAKYLHFYRSKKRFELSITGSRFETFLWKTVRSRNLSKLEELYLEAESGKLQPEKLVRDLIAEEIGPAVLRRDNKTLKRDQTLVFCDVCRPVPGDQIEALEDRRGTFHVHDTNNKECRRKSTKHQQIKLKWATGLDTKKNEFIGFDVDARDRHGLLNDVLGKISESPDAYLYKAKAEAFTDGTAHISAIVEAESWSSLAEIQTKIEKVRGVNRVHSFPPAPAQRLVLNRSQVNSEQIPYTLLDVSDHRFYDREELVTFLKQWLGQINANWLVLHGQKCVGKTSLARYFQYQVVPQHHRPFLPVFICMHSLSPPFDATNITQIIVSEIFSAIRKEVRELSNLIMPERSKDESPVSWTIRSLDLAVECLKDRRLIIMLDEFTTLCRYEETGEVHPSIFSNLRTIMEAQRQVHWLMIAQDAFLRDSSRVGSASGFFGRAIKRQVTHLDPSWAIKLITEPMLLSGIKYKDDSLVQRVLYLTSGNPFFINCLGIELVKLINAKRAGMVKNGDQAVITNADIEEVSDIFVNEGWRYCGQFLDGIEGVKRIVLALVVNSETNQVTIERLISQCETLIPEVPVEAFQQCLDSLESLAMVSRNTRQGIHTVHVPIEIFRRWLRHTISVETALAEWRLPMQ